MANGVLMVSSRVAPRLGLAAVLCLAAAASAESVQFSIIYSDVAGVGFKDATYGAQRQQAFQTACDVWSSSLIASYTGETIRIDASFAAMASEPGYLTLGGTQSPPMYVGSFSDGTTTFNLALPQALEAHIARQQIVTSTPEITMQFNTAAASNFYFGTTGEPANGQYDFTSVATHEIGHGLGFISGFLQDGSYGYSYNSTPLPTIYDYYLDEVTPQTDGGYTLTPLISMSSQTDRAAALVSGELYWSGSGGAAANNGYLVPLYAPTTYQAGSSTSHVDEANLPGDLMSPMYSGVDRSVSPVDLGMLSDMLWDTVAVPEPTLGLLVLGGAAMLGMQYRPGTRREPND